MTYGNNDQILVTDYSMIMIYANNDINNDKKITQPLY